MPDMLRTEILRIASELPRGDKTRRELLDAIRVFQAASSRSPVDEILSKILVGPDLDRDALNEFERTALRFPEEDVILGIASWAEEMKDEVRQAQKALGHLKALERDGRIESAKGMPNSRLHGEAARIYDLLDAVFP
jgi:hypothetical protein